MGKLAQLCEDLAEGTRLEPAWRALIGNPAKGTNSVLFAECQRLIQNERFEELENCFLYLATEDASNHASDIHCSLFGLGSGVLRLDVIRQAVACANLAAYSAAPVSTAQVREIEKWAPKALGISSDSALDLNSNGLETTETIIARALDATEHNRDDKRSFAYAMTHWFSGIEPTIDHRLTIPILLFDQTELSGVVGEIHLTRFANGVAIATLHRTQRCKSK